MYTYLESYIVEMYPPLVPARHVSKCFVEYYMLEMYPLGVTL